MEIYSLINMVTQRGYQGSKCCCSTWTGPWDPPFPFLWNNGIGAVKQASDNNRLQATHNPLKEKKPAALVPF